MSAKKQLNGSADEVEAAFYAAISRGDLDALMALWAEDEEIVCVHPNSPRLIGHAEIRASWEAIFDNGSVHIHVQQVHAIHNLASAIHSVIEEFHQKDAIAQDVHIIATNIYVKTPRGWRIAMHHASVATGQAPRDLFKNNVLH